MSRDVSHGDYYSMLVCLNGHVATNRFEKESISGDEFCENCGSELIHTCPNCSTYIRGHENTTYHIPTDSPPNTCHKCGEPYPWAVSDPEVTGPPKSEEKVQVLCSRFYKVAKQLEDRYNNRDTITIKSEHDVQDLLHALLRIYFDDVRDEEWSPSYAGTSPRVDFLLKRKTIAVEVKYAYKGHSNKDIKKELAIDKDHYRSHPDCETLICFIYDPETLISNPDGFEDDVSESTGNLETVVHINPKGE